MPRVVLLGLLVTSLLAAFCIAERKAKDNEGTSPGNNVGVVREHLTKEQHHALWAATIKETMLKLSKERMKRNLQDELLADEAQKALVSKEEMPGMLSRMKEAGPWIKSKLGFEEKAFEDGSTSAADSAEVDSAGAPITAMESPVALVQEVVVQSGPTNLQAFRSLAEAGGEQLGLLLDKGRKWMGGVPKETRSIFSKTLRYMKSASGFGGGISILEAACDSSAFSCEEIIQLANDFANDNSYKGYNILMVFARGRKNTGCISDPANAESIVDSLKYGNYLRALIEADLGLMAGALPMPHEVNPHLSPWLIHGRIEDYNLKPAEDFGPPPTQQLQIGVRTDEDMEKMQNFAPYGSQGPVALYEPRGLVIAKWLEQIRGHGEQFSGPQLVTLVDAIMKTSGGTSRVVSTLLQCLEQYVTGITCEEVNQIIRHLDLSVSIKDFGKSLDALKPNIVDGQNKVDIIAFLDSMNMSARVENHYAWAIWLFLGRAYRVGNASEILQDVGVGLPPKNNPIFGVVRGNPVIVIVDESTSMDANITLGGATFTRRKFCHSQLEAVLEGLPDGIYFNIIQYSSTAVKIFKEPLPVSKANINAALEKMGAKWRHDHAPEQDPVEFLQNMKKFTLQLQHVERSDKRNARAAVRLAYAMPDLLSKKQTHGAYSPRMYASKDWHTPRMVSAKELPQIYFLTSGQPDGGAREILDDIGKLDNGRNIPVNSIAFDMPSDPVATQFLKDLAKKTGGFFRSVGMLNPSEEVDVEIPSP